MQDKRQIRTADEVRKEFFQNRIGRNKLYDMTKQGLIPHLKVGRRILYCIEDLNDWWEQQMQQSNQKEVNENNVRNLF